MGCGSKSLWAKIETVPGLCVSMPLIQNAASKVALVITAQLKTLLPRRFLDASITAVPIESEC